MHSIIEIDICGTGVISLDKAARARPCKGVRSLVVDCRVRFHFDNNSRTIVPNEFCADQLTSTSEWITFEKRRAYTFGHWRDSLLDGSASGTRATLAVFVSRMGVSISPISSTCVE